MIYVTMSTPRLHFGSNTWEISAWLPHGCSHGVSVCCMCVHISSRYAEKWPVLPVCMQLVLITSISNLHVMLPLPVGGSVWVMLCRCKVIPLKYGSFMWPCRSLCGITCLFPTALFFCMKSVVIMADTLKMMTSYLSNVHFNSWIWFSAQL